MNIKRYINHHVRASAALLAAVMLALCFCAALPRSVFASGGQKAEKHSHPAAPEYVEYDEAARIRDTNATLFPSQTRGGGAFKGVTMNNDIHMDFSNIRVLISISKQSRVNEIELYLNGEYYFTSDMRCIRSGDEPFTVRIANVNGIVYAYDADGNELTHGESLELKRVYVSYTAGYATLHTEGSYNTSATYGADGNNYLGNFIFDANDNGNLRMINTVPMAHYIYGVVEHEMSYTRMPEALKAQAVAAKCFGMCFMSGTDDYDVQDGYNNSTYQMYRGFSLDAGKMTLLPICFSVLGEGMSYEDKIIPTFYAAANGGETTLPSYVFNPSSTRYDGAYDIRHDDVDFNYSTRRRTVTVTYGEPHPADEYSSRFLDFILYKARQLSDAAYNSVVSIDEMYAHSPYGNTTRDMRRVYVRATVTDGIDEPVEYELDFPSEDLKDIRLSDFDGSGDTYSSTKPGVFYVSYKMYWGEPTADGYKLYFCRNGHGIGLSQHGAAAMAMPEYGGWDHYQILSFYYPNFDYISIEEDDPEAPLLSTLKTAAYGRCVDCNAELRSAPELETSEVIMTVEPEEHVDIISVTPDCCWYLVLCGGHMGYLYYTKVGIDLFPAAENAVYTLYDGVCERAVRLYSAPTVFADHDELNPGTAFTVWACIGNWYYIVTGDGAAGYVPMASVTVGEAYEVSCAEPIANNAKQPYYLTNLDHEIVKPVIGRRRIG